MILSNVDMQKAMGRRRFIIEPTPLPWFPVARMRVNEGRPCHAGEMAAVDSATRSGVPGRALSSMVSPPPPPRHLAG
jgi:hypothetical protein